MSRVAASRALLVAGLLVLALQLAPALGAITKFVRGTPVGPNPEGDARVRLVALADLDHARGLGDGQQQQQEQQQAKNYTPVVFWHGMGDTAYGSINIDRLALERAYPGMRVLSLQMGSTSFTDELAGYFASVNDQVAEACAQILANADIRAAGALNAIGFSQGAQFMRALVQRCPLRANGIRVKNLISLGGQHQGVFGLPNCYSTSWCQYIRNTLSTEAYASTVQAHLVQAQYWHDPSQEEQYRAKNVFLPDVNNENSLNETYRANLAALDQLVLVMFQQDDMVVPRESSLFAFYAPGGNSTIRPLEQSPLWQEDRLGLRALHVSGRLRRLAVPGNHLQYKMSWFLSEIAAKHLDN